MFDIRLRDGMDPMNVNGVPASRWAYGSCRRGAVSLCPDPRELHKSSDVRSGCAEKDPEPDSCGLAGGAGRQGEAVAESLTTKQTARGKMPSAGASTRQRRQHSLWVSGRLLPTQR